MLCYMTRYVEWLKNMRNTACTFLVTVFYNYCYYIMYLYANGELCWMPTFLYILKDLIAIVCACVLFREKKCFIGILLDYKNFQSARNNFIIVDIIKYILYIGNVEIMQMNNIHSGMVLYSDPKVVKQSMFQQIGFLNHISIRHKPIEATTTKEKKIP